MENPSCLALTEPSWFCVYTFHHTVSLQMWFSWEVSLLGDTLLRRGFLRTQCGVGTGSKNQSHLTKIRCLVTQTLRQLTHMVPYFKHEEIDAVLTVGSCQDSSARRALLSWWMSGEEQALGSMLMDSLVRLQQAACSLLQGSTEDWAEIPLCVGGMDVLVRDQISL